MDQLLIAEKLEALRRCVARVEAKCPPSVEALASDQDAQDIVVLNLTRAVQQCVDIASHLISGIETPPPQTMADTILALKTLGALSQTSADAIVSAVGFRNVAVHAYQDINWSIVHAIAREQLRDFRDFAREISAYVKL